jgi:type 1 fimbria pilin
MSACRWVKVQYASDKRNNLGVFTHACKFMDDDVMKKFAYVFGVLIALFAFGSQSAKAATVSCTLTSALNSAPALDSSSFPRDAPIGSTSRPYSTNVNMTCSGDPSADRDIFLKFILSSATLVAGYTDVYKTNVNGIGVRYTLANAAGTSCTPLGTVPSGSGGKQLTCHQLVQPVSPGTQYSVIVSAVFVKTAMGAIGNLTTIPPLAVQNYINNQAGTFAWGNPFTGSASGSFASLACSVTTQSVAVTVDKTYTNKLTAVGATDAPTDFNIGLTCDAGVKVSMTVTDANTPTNTTDTLTLNANSSAAGIGYQILNGGVPINFGPDSAASTNPNQFVVVPTPTTGGVVNVPLTARYIRTGPIRAGAVNAKATFTMSYQ